MPIARNPRVDRRRRVLLDGGSGLEIDNADDSRPARRETGELQVSGPRRRSAGYSQEVRRACGQRLVQLIPIRRRSYLAAVALSLVVPSLLLIGHYMIYVSGSLPWYGHPLAVALDASHHRSVAAWFSSHLWLLCLAATILTFQLRRHKLDDYDGEYRLWFWLVLTCLAASVDSTTQITGLFGLALDRWSQINLGWSGPAVVQATLTVLVGMLGLRLCTELKSVPGSLLFWLAGLILWAGSAALAQDMIRLNISLQLRIWLKVAFWLGGLTCVWLAALTYLRSVYLEAQKRFLPRGRLAGSTALPLRQRLRESLPSLPAMPTWRSPAADDNDEERDAPAAARQREWKMPGLRRTTSPASDERESSAVNPAQPEEQNPAPDDRARPSTKRSPLGWFRRPRQSSEDEADHADAEPRQQPNSAQSRGNQSQVAQSQAAQPHRSSSQPQAGANQSADTQTDKKKSRFSGWLRKPKDEDDPLEFKKVVKNKSTDKPLADRDQADEESPSAADAEPNESRRRWLPKLAAPKLPSLPKPRIGRPNLGRMIPKIKLPSFRLPPPDQQERPATGQQSKREASPPSEQPEQDESQLEEMHPSSGGRPMSKAERRRLRRIQKQNHAA